MNKRMMTESIYLWSFQSTYCCINYCCFGLHCLFVFV